MELLPQILLLLGLAVAVILVLHRLHVPSTIGYLLVGVILGPGTVGPVIDRDQLESLAEFGIVFLLFTIGLSFSLPELRSMRHRLPLLGTGQVVLTTLVVALIAWAVGVPPVAAFVVGAVFAQSSTTIIGKQLADQGEENSRSGRLGLAMSVFQDVTAVPFVVVIPVLAVAAGPSALAGELGLAALKAVAAIVLVFVVGRRLLRPLFHLVARRRSAEMFTLTVLLVALASAWTTSLLGLSLAFGAFLAGMTLGETEFRHSVESAIRPFRDVLLGLFFIAIGMLFDPAALAGAWAWALGGAVLLLGSKAVLVAVLTHASGLDRPAAARTGLLMAVGGEFGLALVAIALTNGAIGTDLGQVLLTSVILSMVAGSFLIRHNRALAGAIVRVTPATGKDRSDADLVPLGALELRDHVVVCGYGRIGQSVAHFLQEERFPYVAVDLDAGRVRTAQAAGEPVYYGDAGEADLLDALAVQRARLVVVAHDDVSSAHRLLGHVRRARPDLPVIVRTRDATPAEELHAAGAFEVVPETLEAGLALASQVLMLLDVPTSKVMRRVQQQRRGHYALMRELFRAEDLPGDGEDEDSELIRSLSLPPTSAVVGGSLGDALAAGVTAVALLRQGRRQRSPHKDLRLAADDVLVLRGTEAALAAMEERVRRRGPGRRERG